MLPHGGEAWLAVRHADVRSVLHDPRFSRAAVVGRDVPRVRPEVEQNPNSIMNMDPPDHTRLRKYLARAFTTRRVEALRPRAAELTAELLAGLRAAGPGSDLVEHMSVPFPLTIICELLGVPIADRHIFRSASDAIMSMSAMSSRERLEATDQLMAYMAGMMRQRRITPTEDLIGALVRAYDEGDRLSEGDLLELGIAILVAGHETTMSQISNMTYTLLTRRGRWAALAADPEAVPGAVEELLRYTPLLASAGFPRIAIEDVELSGVMVRAGETVVLSLNAANRDPELFADAEELLLDRAANRHIAFGHGAHHCPGAGLARMELQEVLRGLLREFPDLRLAVAPEDVQWRTGARIRGPRALPLAWGSRGRSGRDS
ncbi:cytochrome P450 [Mycobacterium sp. Aquia_216]|uniref:cytochrome P450 n=1 Tax=Mycobacterium sp. Aquia_216 TaxID=2991729 RepID=UPI00227CA3C4|nr:cytochrome P450 [Mycobacterium sp. Aquia_216]WAJ44864.1 cytochrome P450 [Mycobacterium sp. Aquia_216]